MSSGRRLDQTPTISASQLSRKPLQRFICRGSGNQCSRRHNSKENMIKRFGKHVNADTKLRLLVCTRAASMTRTEYTVSRLAVPNYQRSRKFQIIKRLHPLKWSIDSQSKWHVTVYIRMVFSIFFKINDIFLLPIATLVHLAIDERHHQYSSLKNSI